jgi:diguanylate cyclase (GGDEF)-like protein/PAS domain S-box-containing protein
MHSMTHQPTTEIPTPYLAAPGGLDSRGATRADPRPAKPAHGPVNALPASSPAATQAQLRQLIDIVDHLDAMVAYWNAEQICTFANAAYLHWFGKTREQIVGHGMKELLGPLYTMNLPYIDAAFGGRQQVFERRITLPDDTQRYTLATYTPHRVDGEVAGIFVHVADVTTLKRTQEELRVAKERAEAMAAHDPLTGLPNRLLLHETVARAIAAGVRDHASLALMAIDADHFKAINDQHGHAEGDRLLVELASRLRHSLRACDTVFRVGGDEFIALLPAIGSADEAEQLGHRILASAREQLRLADTNVVASVSIGAALMPPEGSTPDAMLTAADHALYEAKRRGRDRLVIAP